MRSSAGTLCAIKNGSAQCDGSGFGQWVGSLYEDRDGTLWAAAQTGLWRWRPGDPRRYPMSEFAVGSSQTLNESDDGRLLIASRGRNQAARRRERPSRIRFQALGPGSSRKGCCGIVMAVCGSAPWTAASCMSTRAEQMCTRRRTVCPAISSRGFSKIVKATSGSPRRTASTAFAISPSERFPRIRVCRVPPPWSVLAARDGSVWLGALDGLSRWNGGQVTTYRTPGSGSARESGPRPGVEKHARCLIAGFQMMA